MIGYKQSAFQEKEGKRMRDGIRLIAVISWAQSRVGRLDAAGYRENKGGEVTVQLIPSYTSELHSVQ